MDRGSGRSNAPHAPRRGVSLSEIAYARVKADIISCDLLPGSYHTLGELATRCGIGVTPVRTALILLHHEDLVRILPRRGIQIAPLSLSDLQNTFLLRGLLEPLAAALAAKKRTHAQLTTLRGLLEEARGSNSEELSRRQVAAHHHFHIAAAQASGIPQLARLVQSLQETTERLLNSNPSVGSLMRFGDADAELLVAIEQQDAEHAREIAQQGIASSAELMTRAVLGTVMPGPNGAVGGEPETAGAEDNAAN